MKKDYHIVHTPSHWNCIVVIDDEFTIKEASEPEKPYTSLHAMREMVFFWSGADWRLQYNDGDVIKTFLKQLAREIQFIMYEHRCNLQGVIAQFKEREGWGPIDGSIGIELVHIEELTIDHYEFKVLEAPQAGKENE